MNIHHTEYYIKSLFKSKTEYGNDGDDVDVDDDNDDDDDDCSQ